jgi:hypothetical protein
MDHAGILITQFTPCGVVGNFERRVVMSSVACSMERRSVLLAVLTLPAVSELGYPGGFSFSLVLMM